jgi:hypothetical protein
LQRGWCLGSEKLRDEMLQYIEQQNGKWHYGKELRESAQAKAERLIGEECRTEAVSREQLLGWRKEHPFKGKLALKLRTQTTVTVEWIAERLANGYPRTCCAPAFGSQKPRHRPTLSEPLTVSKALLHYH